MRKPITIADLYDDLTKQITSGKITPEFYSMDERIPKPKVGDMYMAVLPYIHRNCQFRLIHVVGRHLFLVPSIVSLPPHLDHLTTHVFVGKLSKGKLVDVDDYCHRSLEISKAEAEFKSNF